MASLRRRSAFVVFAAALLSAASAFLSPVRAASGPDVNPELIVSQGNIPCPTLGRAGQTWTELKSGDKPNPDLAGEVGKSVILTDGTLTVEVITKAVVGGQAKTVDFISLAAGGKPALSVDAVYLKAGSLGSHLYRYDDPLNPNNVGEVFSDDGLTTPGTGQNAISHIAFCYDVEAPPEEEEEDEKEPEASPAVSITKTPDSATVEAGTAAIFEILVASGGTADALEVVLVDSLPAPLHWEIAEESADACSIGAGDEPDTQKLTCEIGTMAPDSSYSVELSAPTEDEPCRTYENTAHVDWADSEDAAYQAEDTGALTVTGCTEETGQGDPGGEPGSGAQVTGPLVIAKQVDGVPEGEVDEYTFGFTITCTQSDYSGSTTIVGEGTVTYHAAIPEGVRCAVSENAITPEREREQWNSTVSDTDGDNDGAVTIADRQGETVTFTNARTVVQGTQEERPPGSFTGEPGDPGAPPPQAAPQPSPTVAGATAERLPATGGGERGLAAAVAFALAGSVLLAAERTRPRITCRSAVTGRQS